MDLIERLQTAFPFSRREIELLIHTAPRRYKIHFIEKRNGRGKRLIAQPTAELKSVQRWITSTYLDHLPVHPAAMAYRPKLGIKDHAQLHAPNRYLLKLDFRDFFPSISGPDFQSHLAIFAANLPLSDRVAITRLLFRLDPDTKNLVLSIGAPSSPALSNTMMYSFDLAVANFCNGLNVRYSRYADDLALSTNTPRILAQVKSFVVETCATLVYPRLTLNEEKTVFTSKKFQRQLTGLVLSNEGVASIGRDRKREIRSMANHFLKGDLSAEAVSKLRGLLAFTLSIDTGYVQSIERMIGTASFNALMGRQQGLNE